MGLHVGRRGGGRGGGYLRTGQDMERMWASGCKKGEARDDELGARGNGGQPGD